MKAAPVGWIAERPESTWGSLPAVIGRNSIALAVLLVCAAALAGCMTTKKTILEK